MCGVSAGTFSSYKQHQTRTIEHMGRKRSAQLDPVEAGTLSYRDSARGC